MPKRSPAGGRTPEELETLLEDALVLGDIEGLVGLFAPRGLLAGPVTGTRLTGAPDIAQSARALVAADWAYVAEPALVLQADRTALVVAPHALNVVRRGRDGLVALRDLPCDSVEDEPGMTVVQADRQPRPAWSLRWR